MPHFEIDFSVLFVSQVTCHIALYYYNYYVILFNISEDALLPEFAFQIGNVPSSMPIQYPTLQHPFITLLFYSVQEAHFLY